MTTYQNPIVVGVFQSEADAKRAIDDLRNAGFAKDQLGFALREGGAVTANLQNDLVNLGVPQDRAGFYNQQYEAGRAIISVRADGREQEVANIFSTYGATGYNNAQGDYYGTAMDRNATTTARSYDNTAYTDNQTDVSDQGRRAMPLREEQLEASTERVQSGEVRLHKDVITEQRNIDVPVTHEEVFVERRNVDARPSDTAIGQEESIRIPVSEEQVNVNKNTVTTGEVEVGKRAVTENQRISDTVRREEARLERDGNPRIQTNDDSWANNTTERDTRDNM
ncbi:MAG: hypothetical protein NVS2B12_22070 [Ktedonobacteraceae bacterium]